MRKGCSTRSSVHVGMRELSAARVRVAAAHAPPHCMRRPAEGAACDQGSLLEVAISRKGL